LSSKEHSIHYYLCIFWKWMQEALSSFLTSLEFLRTVINYRSHACT
jgi:hypothetical protein